MLSGTSIEHYHDDPKTKQNKNFKSGRTKSSGKGQSSGLNWRCSSRLEALKARPGPIPRAQRYEGNLEKVLQSTKVRNMSSQNKPKKRPTTTDLRLPEMGVERKDGGPNGLQWRDMGT